MQHVHTFVPVQWLKTAGSVLSTSTSVPVYGRLHGLIFHDHVVEKHHSQRPPPPVSQWRNTWQKTNKLWKQTNCERQKKFACVSTQCFSHDQGESKKVWNSANVYSQALLRIPRCPLWCHHVLLKSLHIGLFEFIGTKLGTDIWRFVN